MEISPSQQESLPIGGRSPKCGIVMPISAIDGCTENHWAEVKEILTESIGCIEEPKFDVTLVSESEDIGVIQKRIVQNLYHSDIIVCDVSARNANVMFELGMRLAFDKPTVIVKDDVTPYAFDTGVIEHIPYPRDLRFAKVIEFKKVLAKKVKTTYDAAQDNPDHTTFLKHFGTFQVAQLHNDKLSINDYILSTLRDIQQDIVALRRRNNERHFDILLDQQGIDILSSAIRSWLKKNPNVDPASLIGSSSFYSEMESECNPREYFPSLKHFKSMVDYMLTNRHHFK